LLLSFFRLFPRRIKLFNGGEHMQFLSMTRTSPNPRHFARLGRGAVLALALMGTHSGVSADDFAFCTDGVCVGESLCNATQWEMEAPSPENENLRTCAALTLCEEGHAELVAPTATSDRTCGPAAAAAAADEAVDTAPAAEQPVAADTAADTAPPQPTPHHRWPTNFNIHCKRPFKKHARLPTGASRALG
jgi:hypothetical protein